MPQSYAINYAKASKIKKASDCKTAFQLLGDVRATG